MPMIIEPLDRALEPKLESSLLSLICPLDWNLLDRCMIVSGENMAPTENREREMEESNKMQLVEAEQNIPDIFNHFSYLAVA